MKLTQTNDYLLLIDEEAEIEEWDFYYDLESKLIPIKQSIENSHEQFKSSKIIACYPLTKEAKELDLPLLPNPFREINVAQLAREYSKDKSSSDVFRESHEKDFMEGYKAAQSKQFSLEDIKKAFIAGQKHEEDVACSAEIDLNPNLEEYIQSLSIQQLPKEFIPEYTKIPMITPDMDATYLEVLKTITNSEGKQELVGTYKY